MSLGKSPTITARLDANRHNARKSRGPHTARGKAQPRMNSLRSPICSRTRQGGSRTAPRVNCRAGRHPAWPQRRSALRHTKRILFSYVRSRNVIENK